MDDELRQMYRRQILPTQVGSVRCVRVEGGVVIHPDDRTRHGSRPQRLARVIPFSRRVAA